MTSPSGLKTIKSFMSLRTVVFTYSLFFAKRQYSCITSPIIHIHLHWQSGDSCEFRGRCCMDGFPFASHLLMLFLSITVALYLQQKRHCEATLLKENATSHLLTQNLSFEYREDTCIRSNPRWP